MKIGILTFHSQQNYGGVLQCFAMKAALESLGHEVVVIDRWLDDRCAMLRREFAWYTWKMWVKFAIRTLLGCGDYKAVLRTIRSIRFVNNLGLTPFHFYNWSDSPCLASQASLDLLLVGSDQVWHTGDWGYPDVKPYLFEGYSGSLPKTISYAASYGMKSIPVDFVDIYKRGLARFSAISCREKEGVEICRGLGFNATHVVDPTLLADPSCWNKILPSTSRTNQTSHTSQTSLPHPRTLVCYILGEQIEPMLPLLEKFGEEHDYNIQVLFSELYPNKFVRQIPRTVKELVTQMNPFKKRSRVRICNDFGPKEFVKAFVNADACITDSFHAVMFSYIFKLNCRFLKPSSECRRGMFARIEEFAKMAVKGGFIVDNLPGAFDSLVNDSRTAFDESVILRLRESSMEWLQKAIGGEP